MRDEPPPHIEKVPFFKKRIAATKNIRKRLFPQPELQEHRELGDDGTVASVVKTKTRKAGDNPFVQGTKRKKDDAQEEGEGPGNKKSEFAYEASRNVARTTDNGATRYAEWDTETNRDARALLKKHHAEIAVSVAKKKD